MKQLDIQITKAAIKSYRVEFDENEEVPKVYATIALLTDSNQEITTYSVSTHSWNEKDKVSLPVKTFKPVYALAKLLEDTATNHCIASQRMLPESTIEVNPF